MGLIVTAGMLFLELLLVSIFPINPNTVTPEIQSSLEFVLRAFFYYMGKLPKVMIIERNQFGFDYF